MNSFEEQRGTVYMAFNENKSLPYRVASKDNGLVALEFERIMSTLRWAIRGCESVVSVSLLIDELTRTIFDGISEREIEDALILAASTFIEIDPAYSTVAARLLNKKLFKEVTNKSIRAFEAHHMYQQAFIEGIKLGIAQGILDKRFLKFDLEQLAQGLHPIRDELFEYMGLKTLYERYFLKHQGIRFELPQAFWMRVAMGLSLEEQNINQCALNFYELMSTMRYLPGTPTLLHSGLLRPQLSSCFLSTVEDDLFHIFKCIGDNAQMSKWSGGVSNDWTNIRAVGSEIASIKVESQGVVPFLRIVNDTTAAINRSGKRRGATVVYLEAWHLEFEDFIDLRKNTGDERRRTHDINTASWIPDLFMKRVCNGGTWTLFSPDDVPELHHIYGKVFEQKYMEYEHKAQNGHIELFKVVDAQALWKKMLSRLFETGHPWITFKDPCNIRSPQDHVGVVHCSNLCTEITLNTSSEETAVCNLGSVNLAMHIHNGKLDNELLADTVTIAMRMLDNVIDLNFYPTKEGQCANMRHRPVGLGQMGLQDALYKLNYAFDSHEALQFADSVSEKIAYHAIFASSQLARERGAYASFKGSKWDRGLLPQDTIELLEQERGLPIEQQKTGSLNWVPVRESIKHYGMRNSNCMAIAPTATISNISGCFPCIEPIYKNLYVKANMSGEFTVVNKYLVEDLKQLGLWSQDMLDLIKYYDGSVQMIESIPMHIRHKYKEAFELDPFWLIDIAAARGQWIDQSQSYNVFMKGVSGKMLDEIYKYAWKKGMKTTYYLRTLGASQIEKSTLDAKKFGFTQKREYKAAADQDLSANTQTSMKMATQDAVHGHISTVEPNISQHGGASYTYRSEIVEFFTSSNSNENMSDLELGQSCNIENSDCESCQ